MSEFDTIKTRVTSNAFDGEPVMYVFYSRNAENGYINFEVGDNEHLRLNEEMVIQCIIDRLNYMQRKNKSSEVSKAIKKLKDTNEILRQYHNNKLNEMSNSE